MKTLRLVFVILALTATLPVAGVEPYMVRDINLTHEPAGSYPDMLASLGDLALFQAGTLYGRDLWRTDGTPGGTYKLTEAGYSRFKVLAAARNRCFLLAGDSPGESLWFTDGSPGGTINLTEKELTFDNQPGHTVWVPQQHVFYFRTHPWYQEDEELWRSDGTLGGTYRVADVGPEELTSFNGNVYFAATRDPEHGPTLWRSDGTPQGTAPLLDAEPVPTVESLHVVGSRLIFVGTDPVHGRELWISDGTKDGTRLLADLVAGSGSTEFLGFSMVRKRLYFIASTPTDPAQLWVTDGTAGGTRMLTGPVPHASVLSLPQTAPPGRFVFVANDELHGQEIWSTDGTVQGTHLVRDICRGPCSSILYADPIFVLHQNRLYFLATNDAHGEELWVTDGTERGTHLVRDICPGPCDSHPVIDVSLGGRLFFHANKNNTYQMWATDGTAQGTIRLTNFISLGVFSSVVAGDRLIFDGSDGEYGYEPWSTDGTPGGTSLLMDIVEGDLGGSNPSDLMPLGNTVIFLANDGAHGYELWRSDGTSGGTSRLTELQPDQFPIYSPNMGAWTASAGRLYFQLEQTPGTVTATGDVKFPPPPKPWALWTSDGTAVGTYRLTPQGVGTTNLVSPRGRPLTSQVFFSANDTAHGTEPWITDGTVAGTHLLADLAPSSGSSNPSEFTAFKRRVWFVASTCAGTAIRLWQSDGTAEGTVPVGPELQGIQFLSVFKGELWFLTRREEKSAELWSTDGTTAGTRLRVILAFNPDEMFSGVERLYFSSPSEIWASDGTERGTLRIFSSEYSVGGIGARIYFGSHLFFGTYDGLFVTGGTETGARMLHPPGDEPLLRVVYLASLGNQVLAISVDGKLWQTDGTDAGTKLVRSLAPPNSSFLRLDLIQAGSRVFFPAWDPKTGWELWAARP
jgi:ELWxxDGT repeat protein